MAIGLLLLDIEKYELVAIVGIDLSILFFAGFVLYFSAVAFDWRAELLENSGYKHVATIDAWTGRQALRTWSASCGTDRVSGQS